MKIQKFKQKKRGFINQIPQKYKQASPYTGKNFEKCTIEEYDFFANEMLDYSLEIELEIIHVENKGLKRVLKIKV